MTLPVDLVLVRHGQSEGNAAKRLHESGQPEALAKLVSERHTSGYLLTSLGEKQAVDAGAWLRDAFRGGFDRCYVSEYLRAKQTAGLLDLPNAKWFPNFYLCERDSGGVETRPESVRDEEFRHMLRMRENEPFFWKPGNGESLAQLSLRLDRVLDTLHRLDDPDCRVILVCHGEVMWTYRVLLERMSQEVFRKTYLSKEPIDRIHNCQILHYTRRNPERPSDRPEPYLQWMRTVRPTETPIWSSGWRKIERPTYTNEQLLEEVERYRSAIDTSPHD